jgi:iron(III) transport system substrate-binding protein
MGKTFRFLVIATSLLMLTDIASSASQKPLTATELALYKGADRQQVLEEGAKKEGTLTFYTVGIMEQSVRPIVDAFQKKYPYLKVDIWRAGTDNIIPRVIEEFKAGRTKADMIVVTQAGEMVFEEAKVLQPFFSPILAKLDPDAVRPAPGGTALAAGVYETTRGLGYNTKMISKNDVPKTHQDLLNPKWKGKIPIAGSNTGVNWMGTLLDTYGEEFVKKLAAQDIQVHMVSARAVLDMVIAGEYAFSPTVSDSHAETSKRQGAPVEWVPLEPAPSYLGSIMIPKGFPHPYAALLFADFNISEEVADIYIKAGYTSPRKSAPGERRYKRYYGPFSLKQEQQWDDLFSKLFMKK